jgi:hypothetical protein
MSPVEFSLVATVLQELHGSGIETLFWQSNVAWVEAVNPLSYFREAQQQLVTIA